VPELDVYKGMDKGYRSDKEGNGMARLRNIGNRIKRGYRRWQESGEQAALLIWILIIVLLWIKLFHTV
jgi:hypothetical protein